MEKYKVSFKSTSAALALALSVLNPLAPVIAAPARPQLAEIKLNYGMTTVKLGSNSFRIVKALVGTGTASSFDTFSIFIASNAPDEPWMHVTNLTDKGMGYVFRNYESGDANTQATALYSVGTELYAIQASKTGPSADRAGPRKTPFEFETFKFNGNLDVPMFDSISARRSAGKYVDGTEALQHEIFSK